MGKLTVSFYAWWNASIRGSKAMREGEEYR